MVDIALSILILYLLILASQEGIRKLWWGE